MRLTGAIANIQSKRIASSGAVLTCCMFLCGLFHLKLAQTFGHIIAELLCALMSALIAVMTTICFFIFFAVILVYSLGFMFLLMLPVIVPLILAHRGLAPRMK